MYKKRVAKSAGGKVNKALRVGMAIKTGGASEVKRAVVGNIMGPKGQARRQKRRARRAARKASYMGGRMSYEHGGEVMPKAKPC